MKTLFTLSLLATLAAGTAHAAPNSCPEKLSVNVNGLVCDFCARSIEKMFGKRDDVSGIDVNLDKGLITIDVKAENTLDDGTLTKMVTDAGYNVTAINRSCEK